MARLQTLRSRVPMLKPTTVRPVATERIRGSQLQRIRARFLYEHPLCAECQRQGRLSQAVEVDHVVPLWAGGADDDENRQGLCHSCHADKTKAEAKLRQSGGVEGRGGSNV